MFENLEKVLDLVPASTQETNLPQSQEIQNPENNEIEKLKEDYELARETLRKMIFRSEKMLDSLVQIAENSEHPRAFEVATNLVKTISDVASKLEEISSKHLKQEKEENTENSITNINHNHLYVGSSEELIKLIRENNS